MCQTPTFYLSSINHLPQHKLLGKVLHNRQFLVKKVETLENVSGMAREKPS